MKFFANTSIKRNTAFVVLLVWLFALASGVAKACLLEAPDAHSTAAKGLPATTDQGPVEWLAHGGTGSGHHDGVDSGHHNGADSTKESCLKVCNDGTHALPKACSGIDHVDPGPAALVATLWTATPPVFSALGRPDELAIPLVGPPFRVRYSRLAL